MKKRFILVIISTGILLSICVCSAYAEKGKSAAEPQKVTKEKMLERLNEIFQYRLDIRAVITGIEEKQGKSGTVFYEYNGTRLEELDEDILFDILKKVNNQISLKNLQNLQRTQKQLKNLEQIKKLDRTQKMLKQLKSPIPKVPKVYTAPKIPKTYTPPKTYKAPKRY